MGLEDVQLPDSFGSQAESAPQGTEIAPADGQAPQSGQQDLRQAPQGEAPGDKFLDLDKLERFRFGGRDYTPKELKDAILRREDYSKKTAELSETRKYSDNFAIDLQAVIDKPELFARFREVYPPAYVQHAQKLIERFHQRSEVPSKETDSRGGQLDPLVAKEIGAIKSQFSEIQQQYQRAETEKNLAWLDSQYETLGKKYPRADSEVITARAEAAASKGTDITDKVLEKLFKAHHDEVNARWEKVYKEKVNEQVKAGSKAKDTGAGGGTPGLAPRGLKTLKDAEAAMLADIAAARRR